MKIRKLAEIVKEILIFVPETRTSDKLLIGEIAKEFGHDPNYDSYYDIANDKKFPSFESITRARRKVQELYPDLRVEKVAESRTNKETEYIEFALDKSI